MAFFIQYDELGNITATVQCYAGAPVCERQLTFDSFVETNNKKVDLNSLILVDIPEPPQEP